MTPASGTSARNPSPQRTANHIAWPTTAPTRSGWPAPVYWATNVEVYIVVHWNSDSTLQNIITAEMPAPTSSTEDRLSRMRSRTIWSVQQLLLTMNGQASRHSSRLDSLVGQAPVTGSVMRCSSGRAACQGG